MEEPDVSLDYKVFWHKRREVWAPVERDAKSELCRAIVQSQSLNNQDHAFQPFFFDLKIQVYSSVSRKEYISMTLSLDRDKLSSRKDGEGRGTSERNNNVRAYQMTIGSISEHNESNV